MAEICPIVGSIRIIGTKPRLTIIRYLSDGNKCFNDLKRVCKISSKTLSQNLKYLIKVKIVAVKKEKNKHVYFLTKKGEEILPILEMFGKWGKKWKVC